MEEEYVFYLHVFNIT